MTYHGPCKAKDPADPRHTCGSYAFNIGPEQGDRCDKCYWMERALNAEFNVLVNTNLIYFSNLHLADHGEHLPDGALDAILPLARLWAQKEQDAKLKALYRR